MTGPEEPGFLGALLRAGERIGDSIAGHLLSVFVAPGSVFSIVSLLASGVIAAGFLIWRGRKWRHPKVLARALFPRWFWDNPSMRADIGFFVLNTFITATLIGWMLISASAIGEAASGFLDNTFGPAPALISSPVARGAIITVALFLAYDFAYWVDHWLKHRIEFLWEFHRVHHTAEVLSPLTVYRMHPIDSAVFFNILALAAGLTHAGVVYVIGGLVQEATLSGTNILLVAFVFATVHLQHSHIDLRFKGVLGRLFLSPAHHQVHHSTDPRHYGSNLGSCLAVWDLMFGTLRLPDDIGRKLEFGAGPEPDGLSPHSATGALVTPFFRASAKLWAFGRARLWPFGRRPGPASDAAA